MNETQPLPTDATLQRRCAEIVEWQRTGILSGTALREYASAHWAGRHDALQMAERDTSLQAMEAVAKWGTPATVGAEPVGEVGSMPGTDGFTMACFRESDVPIGTKLYTADQVLAMGREPLTRQQLREAFYNDTACTLGGDVDLAEKVCRVVEKAHGIKQGGQHGTE